MKISKKVREEAALICAIAASNPDLHDWYGGVVDALGLRRTSLSFELAISAWGNAFHASASASASDADADADADAEAEAMIRTGWTP